MYVYVQYILDNMFICCLFIYTKNVCIYNIHICGYFYNQSMRLSVWFLSIHPGQNQMRLRFAQGQPGLKHPRDFSCWDKKNLGCIPRSANIYEGC